MMRRAQKLLPAAMDDTSLVAEMRPALVSFFRRRCGNTSEAEDLAQDVLLRALQHARWESRDEAKGYIFKIAVNRWKDRGRRLVTRGVHVDPADGEGEDFQEEIPLERAVESQDELRKVVAALGQLGERTRAVLVLCRLERMKHAEVAQVLGISVSAVEKHLVKALAHLAQRTVCDGG